MIGRIFLMLLGFLLISRGSKKVREPLLINPLGLGMSSINASGMFREGGKTGALFVDPLMSDPVGLVNPLARLSFMAQRSFSTRRWAYCAKPTPCLSQRCSNSFCSAYWALLISALGGILGGYILYFATRGKLHPMIGFHWQPGCSDLFLFLPAYSADAQQYFIAQ